MPSDYMSIFATKDEQNNTELSIGYWKYWWNVPMKWKGHPKKAWSKATFDLLYYHALTEENLLEVLEKWRLKQKLAELKAKGLG